MVMAYGAMAGAYGVYEYGLCAYGVCAYVPMEYDAVEYVSMGVSIEFNMSMWSFHRGV